MKCPVNSTLAHLIIFGMEKNASSDGYPVECMKLVLGKFPKLKTKVNGCNTTPLQYLNHVRKYFVQNEDSIGWGKSIFIEDCKGVRYRDSAYQYEKLQVKAREMNPFLLKYN